MGLLKLNLTYTAEDCLDWPQWDKIRLILQKLEAQGRGRSGGVEHPIGGKKLWEGDWGGGGYNNGNVNK